MSEPDDFSAIVQKPSLGVLLLGLIPFGGMCFSVPWWDRLHPMLLGLPFNLLWLTGWIVLSSLCLWGAYRLQRSRGEIEADPQ